MTSHELHFRIVSADRVTFADALYFIVVRSESGTCTSQEVFAAPGTNSVPFNFVSQLNVRYDDSFSIELFLVDKASNNPTFLAGQSFSLQSFNSGQIYENQASLVGQNISCSIHYRIQLTLPGGRPLFSTPQPASPVPLQPGYAPQPMYAPGYAPQPMYAPGYAPQPMYAPGYAPQPMYAPGYPVQQTMIVENNRNQGVMGGLSNTEAAVLGLAVGAALF
jgi:hypothetical protein